MRTVLAALAGMLRIALVTALAGGCATSALEERLDEADASLHPCSAPASGDTYTIQGTTLDLDKRPVAGVGIDITTAWGPDTSSFPRSGCLIASAVSDANGRYTVKVTTGEYSPIFVALATGEGLAPTLADKRGSCLFGCGTVQLDVPIVPADIATAWREELYADGMEYALNLGLVAYQFRDRGHAVTGVTPTWLTDTAFDGDKPKALDVDRELRFLASSTTLAPPGTATTTSTGYALVGRRGNERGYYALAGHRGTETWRDIGVIAATGWIYFETADFDGQ